MGILRLVHRFHACLLTTLLLAPACSKDSAPSAGAKATTKDQGQKRPKESAAADPDAPAAQGSDGQPLGRVVSGGVVDLTTLVNKSPEEVEALLGEPTTTGSDRISCVRFVPERVFFACEQEIRLYEHDKLDSIRVEYEDGRAALVGLMGLPGEGSFDAAQALALAGLELPGEPRHSKPTLAMGEPGDTVDLWEWGNSRARLRIDGLEHRVRLSVINGEWARSKLEVINNHPLNDDQKKRIKAARGDEQASSEQVSEAPVDGG